MTGDFHVRRDADGCVWLSCSDQGAMQFIDRLLSMMYPEVDPGRLYGVYADGSWDPPYEIMIEKFEWEQMPAFIAALDQHLKYERISDAPR